MQAIRVKYLPATNFKGARLKATAPAGSVTVSRHGDNDRLDGELLHKSAAWELVKKFDWNNQGKHSVVDLVGGGLKDGSYVFILVVAK